MATGNRYPQDPYLGRPGVPDEERRRMLFCPLHQVRDLPLATFNALSAAGYRNLAELLDLKREEFWKLTSIGPKAKASVARWFDEHGLVFGTDLRKQGYFKLGKDENGKPYEIHKSDIMEENVNVERPAAGRPIDAFLGGGPSGADVYGLAFDKAAEYLRDVLRKMCDYVGWKDQTRPYDFDGFSGYYPEVRDNRADICQGDYIVASFFAKPDGGLGFESFGSEFSQYPEGVNPWYPLADIMDGRLCLEPSNLEKARQETHQGQEVIYAIRFGEDTAVGCRPDDVRLKAALVEREPSLRFVSPRKLVAAMDRWMEADARPGFEDEVRPEVIRYAWDGDKLRSEKEVNIDQTRQLKESWGNDWDLIAAMRNEGEDIRAELERAAGIPEGEGRHFKFENALYPSLGIRDDALFLVSGCGRTMGDFITVASGNVSLYRQYDPDNALSEPLRRFDSAKHAMGIVRKHILGEKNVNLATADYQSYLKSQAETKVQKQDNEPSKGMKMR